MFEPEHENRPIGDRSISSAISSSQRRNHQGRGRADREVRYSREDDQTRPEFNLRQVRPVCRRTTAKRHPSPIPYYAAATTAYCRRRLVEAALIDPHAIVFFATDGIVSTRPLNGLARVCQTGRRR